MNADHENSLALLTTKLYIPSARTDLVQRSRLPNRELVPAAVKTHVTSASLPASYLVDPISERELEVLQLVAAGLSNDEIAKKLYLATSTVKRHINNIYAKLDVHSPALRDGEGEGVEGVG